MTKIMPCTCKDEDQDKMYGPQMRVFNYYKRPRATTIKCRCTVCNKTIEIKG